jgi:hypothetical protein
MFANVLGSGNDGPQVISMTFLSAKRRPDEEKTKRHRLEISMVVVRGQEQNVGNWRNLRNNKI